MDPLTMWHRLSGKVVTNFANKWLSLGQTQAMEFLDMWIM
jgi:hypothetical protein